LHGQRLNCGAGVCELEDHVGEKGWSSNWLTKFGPIKKTPPTSFFSRLLENVWVEFAFPYALSPCHKGAKQDATGVPGGASAKLSHYTSLSLTYPIENEMPFVHHIVE
jgi:hypothetical protein